MKQLSLFKKKKRKRTPGVKLGRPATTYVGGRQERETLKTASPLHITLRLREGLPNLRSRKGAQIVKHAILGAQARGLRIIHFCLLSNHLHLIAEVQNSKVFYNSMKSFSIRFSIHLRRWASSKRVRELDHQGLGIFRGRYDVQIIKTPQQMKHVIKYVLLNSAKHFKKAPYIDLFSSGVLFNSWKRLIGFELPVPNQMKTLKDRLREFVSPPGLWLTEAGWMKAKI